MEAEGGRAGAQFKEAGRPRGRGCQNRARRSGARAQPPRLRARLARIGKRDKVRSVPMPNRAKAAIDEWSSASGVSEGPVFRPSTKATV